MTVVLDPCKQHLSTKIHALLQAMPGSEALNVTVADIFLMMEKPPQEEMGDFSLPCFRFAKALKSPPPKLAATLADALQADESGWVKKTATVNAFLNVYANKNPMATAVVPLAISGALFKDPIAPSSSRDRVMIEYSQPNTHKEFHVGHTRNVCLGSALIKLFRYNGYNVTAVNYLGDEGAHIAKCLWMMKRRNEEPDAGVNKGAWLGEVYAEASRVLAEAKDATLTQYEAEISEILRGIESKHGDWFTLWQRTRQWSLDAFKDIYDWLGAEFDRDFFESEVSEASQAIVDEYLSRGVFKLDQGAVGIDLSEYKLGFMLARKRDGNTLYATKDLVLARRKFEEFKIDRSIYVVASEQIHHFKQVFKTLELMGFPQASKCFHLSYGMVVLPEGKMSSRAGNSVSFLQLKKEMLQEIHSILAKYKDQWSDEEIEEAARRLCIGAIKYGMLQSDPAREIVFDLKDWLSFEGNTGPYLMYSYTRTMSILRKAGEAGHRPWSAEEAQKAKFDLTESCEQELLRYVYDFNSVVQESCENYKPSTLCTHLFNMCKSFNRFYSEAPILKAEHDDTRRMRLTLVSAFARTLHAGLGLLGITPPERM